MTQMIYNLYGQVYAFRLQSFLNRPIFNEQAYLVTILCHAFPTCGKCALYVSAIDPPASLMFFVTRVSSICHRSSPACHNVLLATDSVSRSISSYYRTAEQEKDYICSMAKDNGLHTCSGLPPTKIGGKTRQYSMRGGCRRLTTEFSDARRYS